jgi:hypothetical protein
MRMLACLLFGSELALCCVAANAQTSRSDFTVNSPARSVLTNSASATLPVRVTGRSSIRLWTNRLSESKATEPSLDRYAHYVGPSDPSNPSHPLICNPEVRAAIDRAWGSSVQAAHRPPVEVNSKVEFGFAINVNDGSKSLRIDRMETSDYTDGRPNKLEIPLAENTIATVHTHNTGARSTPSAADVESNLPAFVMSQFHLFVTIPGTTHYAAVDLRKVCREN